MLGEILQGLTDPARAEAVLAAVGSPEAQGRIARAAAADGGQVGPLIAAKIRHLLDHGGEEIWLDLVGAMSGSPLPASAAVALLLARAFPDPVRVRITHGPAQAKTPSP